MIHLILSLIRRKVKSLRCGVAMSWCLSSHTVLHKVMHEVAWVLWRTSPTKECWESILESSNKACKPACIVYIFAHVPLNHYISHWIFHWSLYGNRHHNYRNHFCEKSWPSDPNGTISGCSIHLHRKGCILLDRLELLAISEIIWGSVTKLLRKGFPSLIIRIGCITYISSYHGSKTQSQKRPLEQVFEHLENYADTNGKFTCLATSTSLDSFRFHCWWFRNSCEGSWDLKPKEQKPTQKR